MSQQINPHIEMAAACLRDGNLPSAHTSLKRVLRRDPENVDALILYADLSLMRGETAVSEDIVDKLFDLGPRSFTAPQQKRLGGICMQNELYSMGLMLFNLVRERGESDAASLYQEGICLRSLGNLKDAEQRLQECLRLRPAATAPYMQLGHVQRWMANADRAAHYYKRFISLSKKEKGTGYWCLADLKSYEFSDAEIEAMHREVAMQEGNLPQLSALYFALGSSAERNKDYARAIDYYRKANDIEAKLKPFHVERYRGTVAGLQSVTADEKSVRTKSGPVAILIVGLPRCGTTLIEQILSAHSRVQATDELHFLEKVALRLEMNGGYATRLSSLTKEENEFLRQQYIDVARDYLKGDTDFFIDKYPDNFLHIGLIKRILPESIVIDARRDPRDVAISAYRQLFNVRNEFASSFDGIYEYYKGYLSMIRHWNTVYPNQIKTVHYEQLVMSPDEEIRDLLDFCGLETEPGCFEFYRQKRAVMTPSVSGVTQPMYTTSVGQWRNYESHISDELTRLESLIDRDQSPKT
jgi:tetratricopeptide (TPR) repeat protein